MVDLALSQTQQIADEAFALLGSQRQIPVFSSRHRGLTVAAAYDVVEIIRQKRAARGETPVGRKIGFTNTTLWDRYGVSGPIWNYIYDSTLHDLAATGAAFALAGLAEPRIEPEIVLHLSHTPHVGMDDAALLGCIDWIAHGFEIVQSVFPAWKFTAADAIAAFGLHGALLLGDRQAIAGDSPRWLQALTSFAIDLACNGQAIAKGHARNVLGGPLQALRFLLQELARTPGSRPLRAGEIITTGTLTDAMPAHAGDCWTTRFSGIDLPGGQVTFT